MKRDARFPATAARVSCRCCENSMVMRREFLCATCGARVPDALSKLVRRAYRKYTKAAGMASALYAEYSAACDAAVAAAKAMRPAEPAAAP